MTDTQAIKDRLDIVQFIQEYLPLKKAGISWKANCPFHNEKSPSFMVHSERQIWHCFGCSKGGDIFSFLQEMEGLEFPEALKLLAERAGVKLTVKTESRTVPDQRARILAINAKAAHFFHRFLLEMPASKLAQDYLGQRALKPETILEWQLGFIPDQWDLLTKYLLKNGYALDDLIAAGLTIKRDDADPGSGRGYYDRFRGRIMFPIWDVHGAVVGFTGRVLVETERSGGKYVNTPQTFAYDKSRVLYGLNKARLDIKTKNQAVLVEGQMDVIACHQAGMKNVVAASGTALTKDQIRLLKRYCETIAMAFDADLAGENAGRRGITASLEEGMRLKIIHIPDGFAKDADECLKKDPAVWFKAVAEAQEIMEWYLALVRQRFDINNPRECQQAATLLCEELLRIPHVVERDFWMRRSADTLHLDVSVMVQEIARIERSAKRVILGTATESVKTPSEPLMKPEDRHFDQVARTWWGIALAFPALLSKALSAAPPTLFVGTQFFELYDFLQTTYTTNDFSMEKIAEHWSQNGRMAEFTALSLQMERDYPAGLTPAQAQSEFDAISQRLLAAWKKKQHKQLVFTMKEAERSGNRAAADEALIELQKLSLLNS